MKKKSNNSIITYGSGEKTILFLHYFGGNAMSWQWLTPYLENDFKCVLINLPGFGKTAPLPEKSIAHFAQFIAETIDELGLTHYILCGHSMSAKLAAYTAAIIETKPEQLILIAPSPPTVEKMPPEEKRRMLKHPNLEEARKTVTNVTVQQLSEERFTHAVNSQLEIEDATWRWWLEQGMDHDVSEMIARTKVKTTVICSQDDPVIPMKWIENEVKPYFENHEIITWSGVGHLIPMEAPEKLAKTLQKLLKTREN